MGIGEIHSDGEGSKLERGLTGTVGTLGSSPPPIAGLWARSTALVPQQSEMVL